jgi:hypothetical protein
LPNFAFDIYPDVMDYFQVIPLGPGRARLRAPVYGLPTADRRIRAARWLNLRINKQVQLEDEVLIHSVQGGLATSAYGYGYLSEKEACVRQFHDMVRTRIPVAKLPAPPAPGSMAAANAALAKV